MPGRFCRRPSRRWAPKPEVDQYSGSAGYVAGSGQNYSPANDWPANQLTSYTRTIDYEAKSSKVDSPSSREPARADLQEEAMLP